MGGNAPISRALVRELAPLHIALEVLSATLMYSQALPDAHRCVVHHDGRYESNHSQGPDKELCPTLLVQDRAHYLDDNVS